LALIGRNASEAWYLAEAGHARKTSPITRAAIGIDEAVRSSWAGQGSWPGNHGDQSGGRACGDPANEPQPCSRHGGKSESKTKATTPSFTPPSPAFRAPSRCRLFASGLTALVTSNLSAAGCGAADLNEQLVSHVTRVRRTTAR